MKAEPTTLFEVLDAHRLLRGIRDLKHHCKCGWSSTENAKGDEFKWHFHDKVAEFVHASLLSPAHISMMEENYGEGGKMVLGLIYADLIGGVKDE